ncbi:hypothetical protein QYE76_041336 [Lolium multiflorum]|uniref:Uncharacterized protein n=1 Tax=Lolium multiflorum TaxID=4521 RepID=A0AAD8TEJ8_LOLMU|nr:hypothetical protein QYE76_041336 [Lolium multiflorum]
MGAPRSYSILKKWLRRKILRRSPPSPSKDASPNTLRATVTAVGDGPVLQPKKRKRANKKDAKDKAAAKDKDKVALLDKLPNNWRPLHHLGEPMLPEHVLNLLTGDMASLHNQVQYLERQLLKSKNPSYPLFVAKVPTGMNFVEKYPADLCFIRFNDIFSIYRMQMLHFSVVRLVALSLSSQIVKEGTPTIAIMDPFYMRESIICNAGDRAIATRREDFMLANIKKGAILIPYFPIEEDNGMDAWYAILQMQEHIKYADDMLLPRVSREMPTTYVVYKGGFWSLALGGLSETVHRFSGNSYKGYPTRVEAEGRYARYLAGEMRDMRRNRMKTMAFVMMVIVTMLVMFYVIVV